MSSHKPGTLKQTNHKHKGNAGKRAQIKVMGAGKTNGLRKSVKSTTLKALPSKMERVNRNRQIAKQKKEQVWLQKRMGAGGGGSGGEVACKVVGIIPLSDMADPDNCMRECLQQMGAGGSGRQVEAGPSVLHALNGSGSQQLVTFLRAPPHLRRDIFCALEIARAADVLFFAVALPADGDVAQLVDEEGLALLSALRAQGCPEAVCCLDFAAAGESGGMMEEDEGRSQASMSMAGKAGKLRRAAHQMLETTAALPGTRVIDFDSAAPASSSTNVLARMLRDATPRAVAWRAQRSYFLADPNSTRIEPETLEEGGEPTLRVRVSGYLKGRPLSVHSLLHVEGVGACRIRCAWKGRSPLHCGGGSGEDPLSLSLSGPSLSAAAMSVVAADPLQQDGLQMEAVADTLLGEQTWPHEAEMTGEGEEGEDRLAGRDRRALPDGTLAPRGMSSYQADWFMDEEGKLDIPRGEDEEEEEEVGEDDGASILDDMTMGGTVGGDAGTMRRARQQADDEQFPDEVDTPDDIPARQRFARYRALQSFRASPWHAQENLPTEYARLFQFENFAGTQRRLLAESLAAEKLQAVSALAGRASQKGSQRGSQRGSVLSAQDRDAMDDEEEEGPRGSGGGSVAGSAAPSLASALTVQDSEGFLAAGQFVCLELEKVPMAVAGRLAGRGFLLCCGLYRHEQKLSVLHFGLTKHSACVETIKSKDELLFVAGFRSFIGRPAFSESNLNCDKHKFERFLLPDRFCVASVFGPVCVPATPLLVFRRAGPAPLPDDATHATAGLGLGLGGGSVAGVCDESRGSGAGWELVATGSLMSVDPDRITLKKIILTGFPIRVRKKFAVVKHLFHHPSDARWFKPAELVTKWGLRGHITEPVGTHGLLKAQFSGAIAQNDTVMLILYKRVYPKFPPQGVQLM